MEYLTYSLLLNILYRYLITRPLWSKITVSGTFDSVNRPVILLDW